MISPTTLTMKRSSKDQRGYKFKCAYIESVITDAEYEWLVERYIDYDGEYEFFVKETLLCE